MKETIYKCDICFAECDPDMMLHSASERDVCAGCLEKLVDEHFAKMHKFEEILESASVKEQISLKKEPKKEPKKKNTGGEREPTKLTQKDIDGIHKMRDSGATIQQIKDVYHIGYNKLTKIVGKRPGYDWGKAQALRDAGWTVRNIAIEIGCTENAVCNNTKTPVIKANRQHEWITDDLNRLGGEA